jgi:hypothetical protein
LSAGSTVAAKLLAAFFDFIFMAIPQLKQALCTNYRTQPPHLQLGGKAFGNEGASLAPSSN